MPDNNIVKSKRDTALERMKAKHPDRSFDDDEAFFGQINDDYDDYDERLADSQKRSLLEYVYLQSEVSASDDGMEKRQ